MMASSSAALLVACTFLLSYDVLTFRRTLTDHLNSLADITCANVSAALTYHDPKSADLVLQTLKADPHIVAARIYDREGRPFASFVRDAASFAGHLPTKPLLPGSHMDNGRAIYSQPILFDGEVIGSIYLESDLRELHARSRRLVMFVLILTAASVVAAFLLALFLNYFITRPILDLAAMTKAISKTKSFGIRAAKQAQDELGVLVDGFNEMLGAIEKGDSDLKSQVAERIRVEEVLREREAQLQLLLNSTGEAIYGVNCEGECTFINQACLRSLGYAKPEDLLGKRMHDMIHHTHPDGSPFPAEECPGYRTYVLGTVAHVEHGTVWRAEGTTFPVEAWSHPIWRDETLVGAVVTFVDITERERTDAALRVAHTESELFINTVPSILIGTDTQGRITRWNLAAATTFELPNFAVLGKTLTNCGIKWLDPHMKEEVESWLRIQQPERRDDLMFERDGSKHFLGITISPVDFPDQKNLGLLITGADVTERKYLEGQLRQAQKLEAIGQLAAGIAHEINTPTQYIGDNAKFLKNVWPTVEELLSTCKTILQESRRGPLVTSTLAQLLQWSEDADLPYILREVPRAIDGSLEGVQRVSGIVRAMKEFSHPGSENKSAIDVNRAIETTIQVAHNEWKYVADVRAELDRSMPPVPCFAGEFNQVILNLLINAAQAIEEVVGRNSDRKGTITVTTTHDEEWAEIRVQDTGAGIPEEIRPRIFEPFFTTKDVGKGTGQGLALAHSTIVKKHHGQIWFESEVGSGTTFVVRLPLNSSAETKTITSGKIVEASRLVE
jgi:PAS domain S-box-containing protein